VRVTVIGAGVAGLTCALELAERGASVEVLERGPVLGRPESPDRGALLNRSAVLPHHGEPLGSATCSWYAGGMLAPWCELETAEPLISTLGSESIEWWQKRFPGTVRNGSLVVAHGRDAGELANFARRTERFEWLDREAIAALEPDLAGRFNKALFFRDEAHLDPRAALSALVQRLRDWGVEICFGVEASADALEVAVTDRHVIDCRGLAARDVLNDLRGVKGEMLLLRLPEVSLSRPVRVLHPRVPVYIVPRADGLFMVGATMIESDEPTRISVRSMLELLSSAYALHPAFGEAEIVEIGTGVRPAFPDNLPQIRRCARTLYVNGLYRHGFLIAPSIARMTAEILLHDRYFPEVMREDSRERLLA
jgi:glycine oxidase